MIQIKNKAVYSSHLRYKYDLNLIALMNYAIDITPDISITEGYRIQRHKDDLHGLDPVRAIDAVTISMQETADKINKVWIYDPTRPEKKCAVYGDENHLDHIHFQTHRNTVVK